MPASMNARLVCGFVALCALVAAPLSAALAGSFQVNPIRVDLSAALTSQTLTVRNDGSDTLVVQMSVQAWTQEDGQDVHRPTQDALVTPPIAQIAPGGEQVIRVGLRRPPDPTKQSTYRLFVQEVPAAPTATTTGLQVALRVSLPIFVAAAGPVKRDVAWSATRGADGTLRLTVENRGNVHAQILDLALHAPGREDPIARQAQVAYVLAGQRRTFPMPLEVPLPADVTSLRLAGHTDAGPADAVLPLAR